MAGVLYPLSTLSFSDIFTLFSRTVLPGGTIQLATTAGNTSQGLGDGGGQALPTLTMTNTPGGGAIVQYAQGQDGQFFVPGWLHRQNETKHKLTVPQLLAHPSCVCVSSSFSFPYQCFYWKYSQIFLWVIVIIIRRSCFYLQFVSLEIYKRTLYVQSRRPPDSTRLVLS